MSTSPFELLPNICSSAAPQFFTTSKRQCWRQACKVAPERCLSHYEKQGKAWKAAFPPAYPALSTAGLLHILTVSYRGAHAPWLHASAPGGLLFTYRHNLFLNL